MKFLIALASGDAKPSIKSEQAKDRADHPYKWAIELNSLEDILALSSEVGHSLIIDRKNTWNHPTITVYDDYVE